VKALRWLLGLLLVAAALPKLWNPSQFADQWSAYRLLHTGAVGLVATSLPWLELWTGLSLASGRLVRGGMLVTVALGGLFSLATGWALWHPLDIHCGCFLGDSRVTWFHLVLDLLFTGLAFDCSRVRPSGLRAEPRRRRPVRRRPTRGSWLAWTECSPAGGGSGAIPPG